MKKVITVLTASILIMIMAFSTAFSFAVTNTRENNRNENNSENYENNGGAGEENGGSENNTDEEDENQQDRNNNSDNDSRSEEDEEENDEADTGDVDTSWFDYKNPKTEYNITSEAQLRGLASLVNEEQPLWKPTRVESFEGVTFTLTKDIKLTREWTPIGSDSSVSFAGTFDGDGHTISGVDISAGETNTGFFGYLTGEVRNLTLKGTIESTSGDCGGIVGELDSAGRITECVSDIDVSARSKTGGIAGNNNGGTITDSINKGRVKGTYKVGGVVGENWGGTVERCGNEGAVSSSVRGVATFGTGGVAGRSVASDAVVSECYNIGPINSATEATGGVVGYTNAEHSTVINSYNTGDIKIKKIDEKKEFSEAWAGGVVGAVGTDGVVISNCYGAGDISGADVTGGVIGTYIADDDARVETYIENNYYLNEYCDSGIGDNNGSGPAEVQKCASGVTGGSLSGMASALSISYMRDSSGLYGGKGYPVLRWQEPLSSEDQSYIDGVSMDVQRKLDNYLINNTDASNKGGIILSIFNPDNYLTDALLMYSESVDENQQEQDDEENAE